jgi:hypothetical protein
MSCDETESLRLNLRLATSASHRPSIVITQMTHYRPPTLTPFECGARFDGRGTIYACSAVPALNPERRIPVQAPSLVFGSELGARPDDDGTASVISAISTHSRGAAGVARGDTVTLPCALHQLSRIESSAETDVALSTLP